MTTVEYQILQYRPFAFPGEWVAVGVLAFEKSTGAIRFAGAKTTSRARGLFGNVDLSWLRPEVSRIETRFRALDRGYDVYREALLPVQDNELGSIESLSSRVLPPNDASLQFGPVYKGRDFSFDAFFSDLQDRVLDAHVKVAREKITDQQVWKRKFDDRVGERALAGFQSTYEVQTGINLLRFDFGMQNGALHLIEPISFDVERDSVHRKIQQKYGRYSMLANSDSSVDFKVYLPVVLPVERDLQSEVLRALSSGQFGGSVSVELYTPNQADRLRAELEGIHR